MPKSISVQTFIVTSLIHLTMIGTKKHGVGFEDKLRPFSLHDALRCTSWPPTNTRHVHFTTPLVVDR
jgi:hypothetical protein